MFGVENKSIVWADRWKNAWRAFFFCMLFNGLCLGSTEASTPVNAELQRLEALVSREPETVLREAKDLLIQAKAREDGALELEAWFLILNAYFTLDKYEAAKAALKQALERAEQVGDMAKQALFMSLRAELLSLDGQAALAMQVANQAVAKAQASNDPKVLARALFARGSALIEQDVFQAAMEDLLAALDVIKKHPEALDEKFIAEVYTSIANVYQSLGDYIQAIKILKEVEKLDPPEAIYFHTITQYNLGHIYQELGDQNRAEQHYAEAERLAEIIGDRVTLGYIYKNRGDLLKENKQYARAMLAYQQARDIFIEHDLPLMHIKTLLRMADTSLDAGWVEDARSYLRQVEDYEKLPDVAHVQLEIIEISARLATKENDFKTAYQLLKQQKQLLQKMFDKTSVRQARILQARFDLSLKEAKNQLLQEQAKRQEERLRLYMAGALSAVILVFLVYVREHRLKKQLEVLALRDELTGLPNRRYILQLLNDEIKRIRHATHATSVALLRIDDLKAINQHFGHETGDRLLRLFAQETVAKLPKGAKLGRLSGSEWLFVFSELSLEEGKKYLSTIVQAYLEQAHDVLNDETHPVIVVGMARLDAQDQGEEQVLYRIDEKMRNALNGSLHANGFVLVT